jgi:hypothetical protein
MNQSNNRIDNGMHHPPDGAPAAVKRRHLRKIYPLTGKQRVTRSTSVGTRIAHVLAEPEGALACTGPRGSIE